jgi:hypothetical protein
VTEFAGWCRLEAEGTVVSGVRARGLDGAHGTDATNVSTQHRVVGGLGGLSAFMHVRHHTDSFLDSFLAQTQGAGL